MWTGTASGIMVFTVPNGEIQMMSTVVVMISTVSVVLEWIAAIPIVTDSRDVSKCSGFQG